MGTSAPDHHPPSSPPTILQRILPHSRRRLLLWGLVTVLAVSAVAGVALAATASGRGTPVYTHGAVAADVRVCSEMGVAIMQKGGNAVDAAVTTTLCVGVVNAQSSGIGGGGFMVVSYGKDEAEECQCHAKLATTRLQKTHCPSLILLCCDVADV